MVSSLLILSLLYNYLLRGPTLLILVLGIYSLGIIGTLSYPTTNVIGYNGHAILDVQSISAIMLALVLSV